MMAGTVIINLCMALLGFLLGFFFSLTQNGLITSTIRGFTAAVVYFLITYFFRYVLRVISANKNEQ